MLDMVMSEFYGMPAYLVVPSVILVVVCVVLVIRSIVHIRSLSKKKKTVLLLGPRHAGKTSFVHLIRDGEHIDTVSSMKEYTYRFVVHSKYNPDKVDGELTIIDYPGHERLRLRVADYYPITSCIAFVVDASDVASFRKAAEFLYDIFANKTVNDLSPPVIVVCNKSEASGAVSTQVVRDALEKELTKLKTTRSSLETEGDDDDHDLLQVPVGRDEAPFQFDVDAPCEVSFVKCSVKDADIYEVVRLIQHH